MSREREEPVYYREIQKNGYLKRVAAEGGGGGGGRGRRAAPDAMWTVLCVHNGRAPYLEQYAAPEAAGEHRPAWRASLQRARHVTASVRPWPGDEYDFLVAADTPVRMLAPNWDVMQEWVATLRVKLHELKLLGRGENVYCAPPAPPPPRAGTRDPTSPLPPPPAGPAVRVPGIEPIVAPSSAFRSNALTVTEPASEPATTTVEQPEATVAPDSTETVQENASAETTSEEPSRERLSEWDAAVRLASLPPAPPPPPPPERAKVARICGRSVCLDASLLRRADDSDEEFFAEMDRIGGDGVGEFVVDEAFDAPTENGNTDTVSVEETLRYDEAVDSYTKVDLSKKSKVAGFTQRVVISSENEAGSSHAHDVGTNNSGTNITVIQVSNNRGPPHTAIPLVNSQCDVFDFEFKHKLSVGADPGASGDRQHFVNIVNTEDARTHSENGYGAVFNPDESPYGHISLTTTVKLTGEKESDEGIYERLCMASTSNDAPVMSPQSKRKTKDNIERLKVTNGRKTSLPNLEVKPQSQDSNSAYEYLFLLNNNTRTNTNDVNTVNVDVKSLKIQNCRNSNATTISNNDSPRTIDSKSNVSAALTVASNHPNMPTNTLTSNVRSVIATASANRSAVSARAAVSSVTSTNSTVSNAHTIVVSSVANTSGRSVERSQSQNSYDASVRLARECARNAKGHHSPKRENGTKNEKSQPECKAVRGLFRRGLTELSLLSRLKGLGQAGGKPAPPPPRADCEPARTAAVSPSKVVRRSRTDARPADPARRRSSSLSGDRPSPAAGAGAGAGGGGGAAVSLRARQAAALRAEQARGAAAAARLARHDAKREPPVLCDAHGVVWVAWWGRGGAWFGGRAGDRVAAVRGVRPRDAAHARQLMRQALASVTAHTVDILFHRVPHAKIYVLTKDKEEDSIGIKLDGECGIVGVEAGSAAARAGLPPAGPRWALTEVNNRPLDLLKGGEEEVARLSARGLEVSVLLQPLPLVLRLRSALATQRLLHAVSIMG